MAASACLAAWSGKAEKPLCNEEAIIAYGIYQCEISTPEQLAGLAEQLDTLAEVPTISLTLASDLVFGDDSTSVSEFEWKPIAKFSGEFNGNGHAISGLNITSPDSVLGLFEFFNGTVRDLTIAHSTLNYKAGSPNPVPSASDAKRRLVVQKIQGPIEHVGGNKWRVTYGRYDPAGYRAREATFQIVYPGDGEFKRCVQQGLVRVWDEDLNQVAEAWFDEALDGIVVLGDTIYVGIDRWNYPPHAMCSVKRLGLDLSDKGNVDIDLGYWIHFGVQTMATDGKSLFFGNYGAPADKGNPEKFNCTRLTPDLKVVENMRFGCSEGFGPVPRAISKRDTPVFFVVRAMGGNMQGWRKDPVNNPPRIRIEFYEWKDGKFTSITNPSSIIR